MDENITSHDDSEFQAKKKIGQAEEIIPVEKSWDTFWKRLSRIGLNDTVLKITTITLSVIMVALVIWVMSTFFLKGELKPTLFNQEQAQAEILSDDSDLVLPAYEGVQQVEGISRGSDLNTTAPVASRFDIVNYEVVAGDTLFAIAESFGLEPESILWTNYGALLDNPAAIYPGQVLKIFPEDGVYHPWTEGNGMNGFASAFGVTPEVIIEWPTNNLSYDTIGDYANPNIEDGTMIFVPGGAREYINWAAALFRRDDPATSRILGPGHCEAVYTGPIGIGSFTWPTTATYISGFEYTPDLNHRGIDIGGDIGNPIYAADAGVVVYAGWNDWGYGNVIVVDHGNGWQTLYAHLNTVDVGCGDFVSYGGQTIGTMGSTGNSSGPHLHFEMNLNGAHQNPHRYLPY